jgi:hypothetical protein
MQAMHLVSHPAANVTRRQEDFRDNAERDHRDERSHVQSLPPSRSEKKVNTSGAQAASASRCVRGSVVTRS